MIPSGELKAIGTARILIVDDNEMTADFLEDLLQISGYATEKTECGRNAIEIVNQQNIDLVLLDVLMPGIDGITVAKHMKMIAGPHDFLPIILVTALSEAKDKIVGLTYADDYITKPFSNEELLARISSMLRIRNLHRELMQSKTRYECLYENFPHLYVSLDTNRNITECNQLFCHIFKMEKGEIVGRSISSFIHSRDKQALDSFLSRLGSSEPHAQEKIFEAYVPDLSQPLLMNMKAVHIGANDSDLYIVIAMEDVTKKVQLEEEQKVARKQLYRSARLASIGTLASGVAHEINNPLTAIMGFSSALLDRLKKKEAMEHEELRQYLGIINNETLRCRDIVENLSKFARERDPKLTRISITDCINDAIKLANARAIRSQISIVNTMKRDVEVCADANKLEQVIVTILANCIDFCPEGASVRISIDPNWTKKSHIRMLIADNGPGIPAGVLPKVFDPFFTTKEVGQGTGLGLAICHRIMDECNGSIDIVSEKGKGTIVFLVIPRDAT